MTPDFSSFSAFLQMGGYADFVWPAYAIFVVVLLINIIFPWRSKKRIMQKIKDETCIL